MEMKIPSGAGTTQYHTDILFQTVVIAILKFILIHPSEFNMATSRHKRLLQHISRSHILFCIETLHQQNTNNNGTYKITIEIAFIGKNISDNNNNLLILDS